MLARYAGVSTQMRQGELRPLITLAIDIGSEFVDVAIATSASCHVYKTAVDGLDSAAAILQALDTSLQASKTPIASVSEIRTGSTGAVNALLRRDGGPIALLTSEGFTDCLWLGRQNRTDLYDPVARTNAPTFLVNRGDVFGIAGRVDAHGAVIAPLDEAAVVKAATAIGEHGLQSAAICFLFAHVNPVHELRCAELLRELLPGIDVSLSHEIDPQPREYERTVSTCLEAWLRPVIRPLLEHLTEELQARGFGGRLSYGDGRGALCRPDDVRLRVSSLLASGPAASAQCAAVVAAAHGEPTAIALDIGSTSADFALVEEGRLQMSHGGVFAGVPLREAMVDGASIAMGGSSQVIDSPEGHIAFERAPADTTESATLSDALEQLGLIERGGQAKPVEHASAILLHAEQSIASAILAFSVKRNVDPSNAALIAMGGLGGVLGAGIAERLGIGQVIVPPAPAAAGALGLLMTAPSAEASELVNSDTATMTDTDLQTLATRLEERLKEQAAHQGLAGAATKCVRVEMAATAHMHPQYFELDTIPASVAALAAAFSNHQFARFGVRPRTGGFVFSMTSSMKGASDTRHLSDLELHKTPPSTADAPLVFQTAAGSIHKPAGWSLRVENGAYVITKGSGR